MSLIQPSFIQRRSILCVLAVVRHPRVALSIIALSIVLCASLAFFRLAISTEQNQLFSSKPWFFREYLEFVKRFPENDAIYVVLEPADASSNPSITQWATAADAVTARLKALTDVVQDAYCKVPLDQLGRQALLFQKPILLPADFSNAKTQLVPLATLFGQSPDFGTSLIGATPIERFITGLNIQLPSLPAAQADQAADFVKRLADSWRLVTSSPEVPVRVGEGVPDLTRDAATNPEQLGYFYVPNELNHSQHRILVRVYKKPVYNSLSSVTRQVDAISTAAADAVKAFPLFKIGVTGRPALDADQMRTTDDDSHKAESVALIVVFVGMAIMLGSIRLAVFAELTLGVAIAWTFGWATLSVGRLNLLSAVFLIALIGIGMDYLVQILARYRVEALKSRRAYKIWVRVFKHTGPPINTACLGAACAFLTSVFTDFKGAAELGIIAGGGLLLCLLAGYLVLPALLTLLPPQFKPPKPHPDLIDDAATHRRLRLSLLLPVLWIIGLALGARYMAKARFDPGLIDLQVPNLESVKLIHTLPTWVAVVESKDTDQLRQIRLAVSSLPVVASTDSVLNAQDNALWLRVHASELPVIRWAAPTSVSAPQLPALAKKARVLANTISKNSVTPDPSRQAAADSLRAFAGKLDQLSRTQMISAAERLSSWQTGFARELRGLLDQFTPGDLNISSVPIELQSHYVSTDGYYALYIYPAKDLWNDANLAQFEISVEDTVAKIPDAPHVTGVASDLYHTTHSIHGAFFRSTLYALGLIVLLVFLDFRRLLPTVAAVSVLALGLPMLLALMGFLNASWNFANFFGLPILIGAGHEYGVFMVHRYQEARKYPSHTWRRWDVSDRALLLCAFITTSSFGFFWLLAHHRGLKSLGLVMSLGTACIYLATLCVLRPILRFSLDPQRRRARPSR